MAFVSKITVIWLLLLFTVVEAQITCSGNYECWEDTESDVVWVVGGENSHTCSNICINALNSGGDEYVCKGDQTIFPDKDAFNPSPVSDGLDFECTDGDCWDSSTNSDMMWISNGLGTQRACYYPTSEHHGCNNKVENANCFGTRFHQLCPCVKEEDLAPTPPPTCSAAPIPFVPCNAPYECWKDENSDTVWAMGGDIFENCRDTCESAFTTSTEFYACKSDEPLHMDGNALQPISDGMGFSCKPGSCNFEGSSPGEVWVDKTDNCDRTCYFPTGDEYYQCNESVGNANCFGERYTLVCPCNVKPLDQACEWSCPEHSAPVAKWPENVETGTSCLERINYWREKACEDGWPECPPAGLPPIVECTSCHQCANTQSEYDAIHGAHASFTRCGEFVQGSGGGQNCADVIDSFVAEREQTGGICTGHCGPIVKAGCNEFHWGRTEEPNSAGYFHYTLNWGNCGTDTCDNHCDSVAGTDDACFASGIDTPSCSNDPTSLPTVPPTDSPTDPLINSPAPVAPTLAPVAPTSAPVEPTSAPVAPTSAPVEPTSAPVAPTSAPVAPTSAPVAPTSAPVVPTSAPVAPTSAPLAPTSAPVAPTLAPVDPTSAPVAPTLAPVDPTSAPIAPTSAPVTPTSVPVAPTSAPATPTSTPVAPTSAPVAPTSAPVAPTLAPVAPTSAPVAPTLAPVDPTSAPIAPSSAPVTPTSIPVAPTLAPATPTSTPVAPTLAPVSPTSAPVAPTSAPAAPTSAPVAPTSAPVAPTLAPVTPTSAPVAPTSAQPTPSPIQETAAPTGCDDGGVYFHRKKRGDAILKTCEELRERTDEFITRICVRKTRYIDVEGIVYKPAEAVCRETCRSCVECYQNNRSFFYLKTKNGGEKVYKKCEWLAKQRERKRNRICEEGDSDGIYPSPEEACPQICGVCEGSAGESSEGLSAASEISPAASPVSEKWWE